MESGVIPSTQFVESLCLDKGIILPDGTTMATITTIDGETIPVTFIVSEPFGTDVDGNPSSEMIISGNIIPQADPEESNGTFGEDNGTTYTLQSQPEEKKDEPGDFLNDQLCDNLSQDKSDSNFIPDECLEDLANCADLEDLASLTRLEDFMDVVTTYKCKFCRFSCHWKSGLMSHIRCCHIEEKECFEALKVENRKNAPYASNKLKGKGCTKSTAVKTEEMGEAIENTKSISSIPTNEESTKCDSNSSSPVEESAISKIQLVENSPLKEKHIFLCGQCSVGFSTLDECKKHMIEVCTKDHNIKLEKKAVKTSKKRGRPRTRPLILNSSGDTIRKKLDKKSHARKPGRPSKHPKTEISSGVETKTLLPTSVPSTTQIENEISDSALVISAEALESNSESMQEKPVARREAKLGEDYVIIEESNDGKRQIRKPKLLDEDFECCYKRKLKRGFMNERIFKCNKKGCGYRFSTERNLEYHHSTHEKAGKSFICPECKGIFNLWRVLVMHLWKSHVVDVDLFACRECSYKTYNFFKLDNHQKIHSNERPYTCETCGKGFKQISQLRNHVVIHLDRKNVPEKRWYAMQKCDMCDRTFSDTKCLKKHKQAVHSKLKPYTCVYCGHMSARKAMLDLHMRQHTGEKPFACEHCEYRTGDHNSLRRHRMRHTGDKPYKCPHCPYASIQAISYKTHLRNRHPGMDGLFCCTVCTFKTVSKENYINHMGDHRRLQREAAQALDIQLQTLPDDDENDEANSQLNNDNPLDGNMSATQQLIYSCLNAISQDMDGSPESVMGMPVGEVVAASTDGSQTITIQLPTGNHTEPYLFTIREDGTVAFVSPETVTDGEMANVVELSVKDSGDGNLTVEQILKILH